MTTTSTFGTSTGKAIGSAAAYAFHAVALTSTSAACFATDVATGTTLGYAEKSASLGEARIARAAARIAAITPATAIAVEVITSKPRAKARA